MEENVENVQSRHFPPALWVKQNIIVVPVAILLNMWMLKRKSVLFLHMALARMGLQMTLIKRAPTHHPLPLTTYGRDGSEDVRMRGMEEFSFVILI